MTTQPRTAHPTTTAVPTRVRPTRPAPVAALLAAAILLPGPAAGQDRMGAAVAVDGEEVLVLKPGAVRGPAAVWRYRPTGGGWEAVGALRPADRPGASGTESFSASMELSGDRLLVAAGDPEPDLAAYPFLRSDGGAWRAQPPLGSGEAAAEAAAGSPSLADVMRIVQPPERVLAARGGRVAVAWSGGDGPAGVRVWARGGAEGRWAEEARLTPPDSAEARFGESLALRDGRLLVGSPGFSGEPGLRGRVHVYVRDPGGAAWRHEAVLRPPGAEATPDFGRAVAWDGDRAVVGAPDAAAGAGAVDVFARDGGAGPWRHAARLTSPTASRGDRLGASLAVHGDQMLVGAPEAAEGRGAVHRFVARGGVDGGWEPGGTLRLPDVPPGAGVGRSVAVGAGAAAAGAPSADGGAGGAVAFRRAGDGWSAGAWLAPEGGPEAVAGEEVRCAGGRAAAFECERVDLLSFVPVDSLVAGGTGRVSDLWGWTDPETGREVALVGTTAGVSFVDVTEPTRPVRLGTLAAPRSGARDIKVYDDHAFVTGDGAPGHGLRVFDLTRLRDLRGGAAGRTTGGAGTARDVGGPVLEPDTVYRGIESAHNLVIDTTAGFAFAVGASGGGRTCGGGLHMVDIREPLRPEFAGCWSDPSTGLIWPGRIHDAQCVVYRGPDREHRGRQLCFAALETALAVVDVTDKDAPRLVSKASYPDLAYVHQGWLTEDQRHFYLDDELDELVGLAEGTRTLVWDVADLDDPVLAGEYVGPEPATDHNLYVKGDRMYQANYQAGLRVLDISEPTRPREVGHFDTTPYAGNPPGFYGAWTAFPYFDSGTVIVSSMGEGLFVLRPEPPLVP